jgi:hypothetical protein
MTSRHRSKGRRVLRWVGLAAILPILWACNARTFEAPMVTPQTTFSTTFQESLNRQLDLLFMIDNSSSMTSAQDNLRTNMASFMNVLKGLPGGLPDLHVAVVTSDMGVGPSADVGHCTATGDAGGFQAAPRGTCTATGLDPGATFLIDSGGSNEVTNFGKQDITAVFQCIAAVGDQGCGFEHQLASVVHALGADNIVGGKPMPPPGNAGFLRDDAYLGIVLLTNEDDCSAPPDSPLWTPVSQTLGSTYGPTQNFVCNEFGHLCVPPGGGTPVRPSRLAPTGSPTDVVTYSPAGGPDNCISAEDQGMLTAVGASGFAGQVKALKTSPVDQILVASIAGPTTEYTVTWATPPTPDTGPWPSIKASCGTHDDMSQPFADPGVRLHQFVGEFGEHGLSYPFCSTDYSPALMQIAKALGQLLGPKCVTGTIANKAGTGRPDCTVTDVTAGVQSVVHACADDPTPPCWALDAGTGAIADGGNGCTPDQHVLDVMRGGADAPPGTKSAVDCQLCVDGHSDPSRGCP